MFGGLTNFEGSLFDDLRRMQQELEEVFGPRTWPAGIRSVVRGTYPPINVAATSQGIDVYCFAAGLAPSAFDISIQQNLLTVAGERRVEVPEGAQYYRQERFDGAFKRVITLPDDADPEQVSAQYEDGILHIAIRRRESSRPRQIEIK
ncbi:MAG: Hsp20/alpha crystallin family protein [Bdellovibrio bacteriovorus]